MNGAIIRGLPPSDLTIDTACQHYDRAVALLAQGQYAPARVHEQQTLLVCEHTVGLHHPDIANILNTLAEIAAAQDAYDEAEQLATRSVGTMTQVEAGDEAIERIRVQSYTPSLPSTACRDAIATLSHASSRH